MHRMLILCMISGTYLKIEGNTTRVTKSNSTLEASRIMLPEAGNTQAYRDE